MTKKDKDTYTEAYREIKIILQSMQSNMESIHIITDNEINIYKSFEGVFREVCVVSHNLCTVHYRNGFYI